jgi:hypothetical protein
MRPGLQEKNRDGRRKMLGELVCELKGKVKVRRVLPHHEGGMKVEVSTESSGKLLGVDVTDMTTYEATMQPGGFLFGMGQGATLGKGGEMAMYRANGVGKMTGKGSAVSFRGALYMMSPSPRWASLNGTALVFEYEEDENGNTGVKVWEWK